MTVDTWPARARRHMALAAVSRAAERHMAIPSQWRHLDNLDHFAAAASRAFARGASLPDVAAAAHLTAWIYEQERDELAEHPYLLAGPPAVLGLDDVDVASVEAALAHRLDRGAS